MNRPVIMRGKKVSLGMIHKDDISQLWEWINETAARKFTRFPDKVYFFEDELEWYESLRKGKETNRVFLVVDNETSDGVGLVGLHGIDHLSKNAEVGYIVSDKFRNRGFGTEAVELMVDYAKSFLNLRKVFAYVKDSNPPSSKVLESNKFKECGRLKNQEYVPGYGYSDLILYELFLNEN